MGERRTRFVPILVSAAMISCVLRANAEPVQLTVPVLEHHDVSPPLRDLLEIKQERPRRVHEHLEVPQQLPTGPFVVDQAVQTSVAPLVATTPWLNPFAGLGLNFPNYETSFAPPDPNGAVGAFQFVETVNVDFAVFSKATGELLDQPAPISTLWQGFGGACAGNDDTDPIVLYDKLANRWVMSRLASQGSAHFECIAVSQTADAFGMWNRYAWQIQVGAENDYPKIAVWPDAYYATFNMFSDPGDAFLGPRVCAFDRAAMLVGGFPRVPVCCMLEDTYSFLLPSDLDGFTAPPAGAANYVMGLGTDALLMWRFHPNFAAPSCSDFTSPISIPVAAFNQACGNGGPCVPQGGTTQLVASLGNRLMHRLAYRNFGTYEALVATHSVRPNSRIRWYEIRSPATTPMIFQQGTFAPPDTSYRWNQSIAMDRLGNIAVGYNVSSATMNPAIRYTGRAVSDPLGTFQSETTIIDGTGSQVGRTPWGDYSSMSVDPIFDCTFWYVNEYYETTTPPENIFDWDTRIASFRFPSCTQCVADCDRSYNVGVSELVTVVNVSLGLQPLANCYRGDEDGDGRISVSELVRGVNYSLEGCPVSIPSGSFLMMDRITIGTGSNVPGASVAIPISVIGSGGMMAGVQVDILYDENVFSVTPSSDCAIASRLNSTHQFGSALTSSPPAPSGKKRLRVLVYPRFDFITTFTDGEVASCTFHISSSAAAGSYVLDGERQDASDVDGNVLGLQAQDGSITVCGGCGCS